MESEKEARRRIERALTKIEQAQMLLGEACGDLSSIIGACREWGEVSVLYDQVKATWHSVNSSTATNEGLHMDSNWKPPST